MPVVPQNFRWQSGVYAYPELTRTESPDQYATMMPTSWFTDGVVYFGVPAMIEKADVFFASADGRTISEDHEMFGGESLTLPVEADKYDYVYFNLRYSEFIMWSEEESQEWIAQNVKLQISPYYFTEASLGIYITPQQLQQFKNMYPDCVADAYRAAVGELTANIGNIFDMSAMLGQTDEDDKDDTIRWILQVMTAYNIASPSLNYSEPLAAAYEKVAQTIIKLKGGIVSLEEPAPYRTDSQNANAEVITSRYNYLG